MYFNKRAKPSRYLDFSIIKKTCDTNMKIKENPEIIILF